MPFTFNNGSSVAIGTFNIHIFQPEWIGVLTGVPFGTDGRLHVDFTQPGLQVSFENSPLRWTVRPERILVETDHPDGDCGVTVAEVLTRLPLTPIRATGNNLTLRLQGERSELGHAAEALVSTLPARRSVECNRRHFGGSVKRGDVTYTLVHTVTDEKVDIDVNAHRDVIDAAGAAEASRLFKVDCRTAAALAMELFGVTITPWW